MNRRDLLGLGTGVAAGLGAAALGLGSGVARAAGLPTRYVVPGERTFPGGLAYDRLTGRYYTGSTANGALFSGSVREPEATLWKPAGSDGRTVTAGLALDAAARLYVAGGSVPAVWIYDTRTGRLLAKLATTTRGFTNEIAVTPDGVYVTDSYEPVIYRITRAGGRFTLARWRELAGTPIAYDGTTVALNGIIGAGPYLLSVHSSQGRLFRIDRTTGGIAEVDLGGLTLRNGDGLLVRGATLFVVQGSLYDDGESRPRVTVLEMSRAYDKVLASSELTGDLLHPSAVQLAGGRMLIVNSQYNRFIGDEEPELPFTISVLDPGAGS
ncbi:hypothetical protein [Streptomyces boninensis]|uniref:hypothetical protein n=1 Tax=Streptomyces boninensis TaxID=2039455 RepID=UPI003B21EB06